MTLYNIFFVLVYHWFADFYCQSSWMAQNKSKNWQALTLHVLVYSVIMTLMVGMGIAPSGEFTLFISIYFFLVTFAAHFVTDAITSRITSHLYRIKDYHNFFVVIGIDQLFHYAQLFLTLHWLRYYNAIY